MDPLVSHHLMDESVLLIVLVKPLIEDLFLLGAPRFALPFFLLTGWLSGWLSFCSSMHLQTLEDRREAK
jgi:hypothetical protein